MLGWTVLFALVSLSGLVAGLTDFSSSGWIKVASVIFGVLFVVSLLARAARGRAN